MKDVQATGEKSSAIIREYQALQNMKCGSGSATLPFLIPAYSKGKPDSADVIYSHHILPNNLMYKILPVSKVCIGMERVPILTLVSDHLVASEIFYFYPVRKQ
jgi:hypothetical protein